MAQLLSFLRTGFYFFLTCSVLAFAVLVPINYREHGTSEGVPPPTNGTASFLPSAISTTAPLVISTFKPHLKHGSTLYLFSHLAFTYVFTILALVFLNRNWKRYIPLRQLFSLELAQSIPARTVMVTNLPPHLRSERSLAEYFENIRLGEVDSADRRRDTRDSGCLAVESVVVTRAIGSMRELLERRTRALATLEKAWSKYLGNPVPVEGKKAVSGYDREAEVEAILQGPEDAVVGPDAEEETSGRGSSRNGRLIDVDDDEQEEGTEGDLEAQLLSRTRSTIVTPGRKRPTIRPHWFAKKVDALDYYADQFRKADEAVRKRRKGKFRPTGVAFVTFQTIASAQVAAQVVHYPSATEFQTELGELS